jgi:hypothetical protein
VQIHSEPIGLLGRRVRWQSITVMCRGCRAQIGAFLPRLAAASRVPAGEFASASAPSPRVALWGCDSRRLRPAHRCWRCQARPCPQRSALGVTKVRGEPPSAHACGCRELGCGGDLGFAVSRACLTPGRQDRALWPFVCCI